MTKKLGAVEQAVLAYLQLSQDCGGCRQAADCSLPDAEKSWHRYGHRGTAVLGELCLFVEGLAECPHKEDWLEHINDFSDTRYKSVHRAVKGLEHKGWVQTELRTQSLPTYGYRFLLVRLVPGLAAGA